MDNETAVQPVGGLPLTNPAALQAALDQYTESRHVLLTWIRSHLVAGVDYRVSHTKNCSNSKDHVTTPCPKCEKRASLVKPGAEKICGFLRIIPTFHRDQDTWEMLSANAKEAGTFCLLCKLHANAENGPVVAEGRGCRTLAQDYGVANTSIKMAEKSSQVNATLRLGGLSELFTQDVRDDGTVEGTEVSVASPFKQPPPRKEARERTAGHGAAGEPPTDAHVNDPPETASGPPTDEPTPEEISAIFGAGDEGKRADEPFERGPVFADGPVFAEITDAQIKMLYGKLRGLAGKDEARFAKLKAALKDRIHTEFGCNHISDLPRANVDDVVRWLDDAKKRGGR